MASRSIAAVVAVPLCSVTDIVLVPVMATVGLPVPASWWTSSWIPLPAVPTKVASWAVITRLWSSPKSEMAAACVLPPPASCSKAGGLVVSHAYCVSAEISSAVIGVPAVPLMAVISCRAVVSPPT